MSNSPITVIAGAAIELGRACALRSADAGGTVVLLDEDEQELETLASEIEARGARPIVIAMPLDNPSALRSLAERFPVELERVDALVNCQFAFDMANVIDIDLELWEQVVRTNLTGPLVLGQALLELLKKSDNPSIVNVGTIDGVQGNPWLPAYSSSKGGLVALTHVMAHDYGQLGVRVNYVARCGTKEMKQVLENATGAPLRADWEDRLSAFTPLGRIGSADETAAVIEFLNSDAASFVNGAVYTVDGGRTGLTPGTI